MKRISQNGRITIGAIAMVVLLAIVVTTGTNEKKADCDALGVQLNMNSKSNLAGACFLEVSPDNWVRPFLICELSVDGDTCIVLDEPARVMTIIDPLGRT